MALSPNVISSAIVAAGADVLGLSFGQFAVGIGAGVYTWATTPGNYVLVGSATGFGLSPGTVNGKLVVAPSPPIVIGALQAAGVNGVASTTVGKAVAVGVASAFAASAQYTGVSPTLSVGADVSAVSVSNPATLISILIGTMTGAFGGAGLSLPTVATGLGNGIAAMLATATGQGAVTGVSDGTPSTSVTTSQVF